jgi:hypothetical protein
VRKCMYTSEQDTAFFFLRKQNAAVLECKKTEVLGGWTLLECIRVA